MADSEPYSAPVVRRLCRSVLQHEIRLTRHARDRMIERDIDEADIINVLRGGAVSPPEIESGTWRYRIFTPKMWVIVAFRSETCLVVITVCKETT